MGSFSRKAFSSKAFGTLKVVEQPSESGLVVRVNGVDRVIVGYRLNGVDQTAVSVRLNGVFVTN